MRPFKTIVPFFMLLALAGCVTAPPDTPDPLAVELADKILVAASDIVLDMPPVPAPGDNGLLVLPDEMPFLWDHFNNTNDFSNISTRHWRANWHLYRQTLLSKADANHLDVPSLRRCLDKIDPARDKDGRAILPVAAFYTKQGTEPVWVIVCHWEYSKTFRIKGEAYYPSLGHFCKWALRARDAKEIDFVTCM